MPYLIAALQIVIALGICNVWLLRFGSPSAWRGGEARNMKEEFAVYRLPRWAVFAVGSAKLLCATGLLVGLWVPVLILPSATGLAVLMSCAVAMHVKVKDPMRKALPAFGMLMLCLVVSLTHGLAG